MSVIFFVHSFRSLEFLWCNMTIKWMLKLVIISNIPLYYAFSQLGLSTGYCDPVTIM